jgi:hypothetical protein
VSSGSAASNGNEIVVRHLPSIVNLWRNSGIESACRIESQIQVERLGASPKEFVRSTDGFIDVAIVTKGQPTIIGLGPHPDAAR